MRAVLVSSFLSNTEWDMSKQQAIMHFSSESCSHAPATRQVTCKRFFTLQLWVDVNLWTVHMAPSELQEQHAASSPPPFPGCRQSRHAVARVTMLSDQVSCTQAFCLWRA